MSALRRTIDFLVSPRLTVICLALLLVLTFWGTVYQVNNGLYAAQQRFFNSWFFMQADVLPFPGAQLVMAVLTVNLMGYLLLTAGRGRLRPGMLITHGGILIMLVGGAITHYFAEESTLALIEGEASNVSMDNREWEIAAWSKDGDQRDVRALTLGDWRAGDVLPLGIDGLQVTVESAYPNARALQAGETNSAAAPLSAFGIGKLQPHPSMKDPAQNVAGGLFTVTAAGARPVRVLLYGEDTCPVTFPAGGREVHLSLRHRRIPLPMTIQLADFKRDMHPGTDMARSFSSRVTVIDGGASREVTISMNKPLRQKGYTFYQSSYQEPPDGREVSIFAVTRNHGRLLPYLSTIAVSLGMAVHFGDMLFRRARRREDQP